MNTFRTRAASTAMALCLAALGQTAAAQDTLYLGRIVIGTTEDGTPIYAGENTSSVEGNSVTAQGGTARIDDVLRQMPGISTRIDPGNPGVAVAIRGLQGQGRVAMQVEGVPQTFRFLGHTSEGYAYVEPSFLTGIDVTRGAVVTAGGSGIAGGVNFRLLRPQDVVPGEGWGSLVRLSYGSNGHDLTRMAATGHVGQDLSVMAALSATDSDPFTDGAGSLIANSRRDTSALMFRAEYRIDDSQSFEFLATRNSFDFAANSYNQDLTSDMLRIGYSLSTGDLVNLNAKVYRASTRTEYLTLISSGLAGASTGRIMETTTTGFDLTNTSTLSLGGWDLTSSNGFEYTADSVGGTNTGVNPSVGDSRLSAVFTENVFSNGPWEITAALRATDYRLSGAYDGSGTAAFPAGTASIDETSVDPKLTLAYQATDWLQPYVSVFRTTRMPSLQEMLQDSYHPFTGFTMYLGPNPTLTTETARGGEIGFNLARDGVFRSGDALTARVAYFKMDVDDYIAQVSAMSGGTLLYYYDNIPGTTVSKGLEIEASYESDRLSAALSYTNARSTPPSTDAGYYLQPEETLSATVAGHWMGGALTVGTTYSHTAGGVSLDSGAAIGSYGLWDVFARYDVTETFQITAKVSNVTDQAYRPWGGTGNGTGRSAFIGAEIRF